MIMIKSTIISIQHHHNCFSLPSTTLHINNMIIIITIMIFPSITNHYYYYHNPPQHTNLLPPVALPVS